MIQRIRSSIEKLPSLDFCSMIAHNPLRAEVVFSNFYEEISFKKMFRAVSVAPKANIGKHEYCELGNSPVGNITSIHQMGRQNMV